MSINLREYLNMLIKEHGMAAVLEEIASMDAAKSRHAAPEPKRPVFEPAIYAEDNEWLDPESIRELKADFSDVSGGYVKCIDSDGSFLRRWHGDTFPLRFKDDVIAIIAKRLAAKKAYDATGDLISGLIANTRPLA